MYMPAIDRSLSDCRYWLPSRAKAKEEKNRLAAAMEADNTIAQEKMKSGRDQSVRGVFFLSFDAVFVLKLIDLQGATCSAKRLLTRRR